MGDLGQRKMKKLIYSPILYFALEEYCSNWFEYRRLDKKK